MIIVVGLIFASTWTDVLWYRQLGFLEVFRTELLTKTFLFILGAAVMAGAVLSSLLVAYRTRPVYAPVSPEQANLDRYRESIEPLRRIVIVALPTTLGLFAGSALAQQWQTFLLWWNRVPFGRKDAQFGMDIGFFVFSLPFLQYLVGFLTAIVFLSSLAAVITHYLYGGLRLQGAGPRIMPAARMHLSILAAAFLILRGLDYWLDRYALTTEPDARINITGLTYSDANAHLTAKGVLAAIAVIIAVLFLVSAFTDRWGMMPIYGVALLVVCLIVIGSIYPAIVQRFQVTPNARNLEEPYIQRAISATRDAYGLSDIEVTTYQAQSEAEPGALRNDAETVPGIRLLDPSIVSDAFRQLQQIRQYYAFPDSLDVDRYTIDGEVRDTVIAVREVDLAAVPASERNWVNDHITYTHGFGVVAAYGNQRGTEGRPAFFQQGIPSTGELGEYEPRVYFGEKSSAYSIVGAPEGAPPKELDFPDDESPNGQQNTTYQGDGGVKIGSLFTRMLYALKFREQNILLSDDINSESQILYDRNPRQRVQKVAPFLTLDGDPYPAVVDGRIKWIIDGYTTSSRFPYSMIQELEDATSDSLTATSANVVPLPGQRINYMRNSVKATVDAYDGKVTLYAWDEEDPVLKAWRKAFPDAVQPLSEIDGELMSHLRYPEDLFKVQRQLLTRYHVSQAAAFFGGQDFWRVPDDPTKGSNRLQPPYYLTLEMPGQEGASFSLTSTFIPVGGARNVLTGFLAVDADAGSESGKRRDGYGTMRLLQLPRDSVVPGPGQVQNTFNANPTVSQQLNLLRGGASSVESGNLLTLPVGGGLLYVQPVYIRGSGQNSFPLLQRVLVAFGDQDQIGFAPTLQEALDQVFGGNSGAAVDDGEGDGQTDGQPGEEPATQDARQQLQAALRDAAAALRDGQAALAKNDFAAYGEAQKRLEAAIQRAVTAEAEIDAASGEGSGTTPAPTPSPGATSTDTPSPTATSSP